MYEMVSGQKINYKKSSIFFSKFMSHDRKKEILRSLYMRESDGS